MIYLSPDMKHRDDYQIGDQVLFDLSGLHAKVFQGVGKVMFELSGQDYECHDCNARDQQFWVAKHPTMTGKTIIFCNHCLRVRLADDVLVNGAIINEGQAKLFSVADYVHADSSGANKKFVLEKVPSYRCLKCGYDHPYAWVFKFIEQIYICPACEHQEKTRILADGTRLGDMREFDISTLRLPTDLEFDRSTNSRYPFQLICSDHRQSGHHCSNCGGIDHWLSISALDRSRYFVLICAHCQQIRILKSVEVKTGQHITMTYIEGCEHDFASGDGRKTEHMTLVNLPHYACKQCDYTGDLVFERSSYPTHSYCCPKCLNHEETLLAKDGHRLGEKKEITMFQVEPKFRGLLFPSLFTLTQAAIDCEKEHRGDFLFWISDNKNSTDQRLCICDHCGETKLVETLSFAKSPDVYEGHRMNMAVDQFPGQLLFFTLMAMTPGYFKCNCGYHGQYFYSASARDTNVWDVIVCPECHAVVATPLID